ncbi:MAG: hypothetical protein IT356_06360 [Gemmatimonadaceae bacterium]|nr:hypothetical protein [Gemmatimonadaceae bacterium]
MSRLLSFTGALLVALPVAAQQPAAAPPACDVDQMSPGSLAIAAIARNKAVQAKSPDEGMKTVRDAMKNIFDKQSNENPIGRDYSAAQFMILAIEFGGEVQPRGNLNLPGDKKAPIDLVVAADSLFKIVETAKPGCKEDAEQWRQYKPYASRIKAGYEALAANQLDSAQHSAERAMILSREAPQAFDLLWRLAAARGDDATQLKYLRLTVDKLASDTANARTRANLLFNLGRIQQDLAEKAPAGQKAALLKGATDAYLEVISQYPGGEEAPYAVNGISVAWALTQDSTGALAAIKAALPQLSHMSDQTASQMAILATRLNHSAEAAQFFKDAVDANPYWRDYLYNYAATLFDLKKPQEMLGVVGKLLDLDPSNPDNVLLNAYAYKGLADAATDAAIKKAYTDSAVAYTGKSDAMKTKVSFGSFDRGRAKTQLKGEIENRDKAARSYTLDLQFLDKSGAVIETKSVTVGPVAPNATGAFDVEVAKGGVMGVKYAPIP